MSVIAVRNNIMAADSGASMGDTKFKTRKLIRRGNTIIGFVGNLTDGELFAQWYFDGANLDSLPSFHNREGHKHPVSFVALVLTVDSWDYWDEFFVRDSQISRYNEFMAIGAGGLAALGAMHMGATAIDAVDAGCKYADGCELPVMYESLKGL